VVEFCLFWQPATVLCVDCIVILWLILLLAALRVCHGLVLLQCDENTVYSRDILYIAIILPTPQVLVYPGIPAHEQKDTQRLHLIHAFLPLSLGKGQRSRPLDQRIDCLVSVYRS